MEYLGQCVGGDGGSQGQARPGWGSFEDDLYRIISFPADSSEKYCLTLQGFVVCSNSTRNKLKTHHDVIPISCLTEFPNVVQMAKVRRDQLNVQQFYRVKPWRFLFFRQACLWRCERGPLFPRPLPKSKTQFGLYVNACGIKRGVDIQLESNNTTKTFFFAYFQASRLIVTFDEHVISNNFKFGVIYQKFGQVSNKECLLKRAKHLLYSIFSRFNRSLSGKRKSKHCGFRFPQLIMLPFLRIQRHHRGRFQHSLSQSQPYWAQRQKLKSPWMVFPADILPLNAALAVWRSRSLKAAVKINY